MATGERISTPETSQQAIHPIKKQKKTWRHKKKSIQYIYIYMGVSKNRGTPKSSILIGFSIINHPFWGTPIFGNTNIYLSSKAIFLWVKGDDIPKSSNPSEFFWDQNFALQPVDGDFSWAPVAVELVD